MSTTNKPDTATKYEMRVLADILSDIAELTFESLREAVNTLLPVICQYTGLRSSCLVRYFSEEDRLEVLGVHNEPDGCDIPMGMTLPSTHPFCQVIATTKATAPLIIDNLQNHPSFSSDGLNSHPPYEIMSFGGVPILLRGGTWFGTLCVLDPETHSLTPEQTHLLVVAARRLAGEIEQEWSREVLRRANIDLQQANRTKSNFVSVIDHDFRSGLTTIQGFSDILSLKECSLEEVAEFATYIHTDAKRLAQLIADLLDLDRMETGSILLQQEQVDMNMLLTEVIARVQTTRVANAFPVSLDPLLLLILGDKGRLRQAMTNMLTAAISLSPPGDDIILKSIAEEQGIHIQVCNESGKHPQQDLERMFERPSWVDTHPARAAQGPGLRLPLARQIVHLHGGTVWAESILEKGFVLHVTIPYGEMLTKQEI